MFFKKNVLNMDTGITLLPASGGSLYQNNIIYAGKINRTMNEYETIVCRNANARKEYARKTRSWRAPGVEMYYNARSFVLL